MAEQSPNIDPEVQTPIIRGKQPFADFFGTTQMETAKLSYLWTIKDFNSLYSKEVEKVVTEKFYSLDEPVAAWQLLLKIGARGQENLEFELHHLPLDTYSYKINIKAKISILNADLERRHTTTTFEGASTSEKVWSKPDFIEKTFLMENAADLLPNNSLTIFCEILQSGYFNTQRRNKISTSQDRGIQDYSKLFENSLFCDLVINVSGTAFEAHKAVISARSPVFWAMFNPENNMIEQDENKVKITDISPKVFKELLRYIYYGEIENIEEIVSELIVAADKYALDGLKTKCEKSMFDHLKVENAMEFLIVVDQLQIKYLKEKILKFIKSNLADVIKQKTWDQVFNQNIDLATEIVQLQITSV